MQRPRLLHGLGGAARLGLDPALTQHLSGWHRLAVDGSWARGEFNELAYPIRELAGRTLGIVGWGELGRAVAAAAEAFGMRVIVCNRPGAAPMGGRVLARGAARNRRRGVLALPVDARDPRPDRRAASSPE